MKKIIVVMLFIALPFTLFADFYLGPTAMYMYNPKMLESSTPNVGDFAFGADAKLTFSIVELQAMALYNLNESFDTYLDVGIIVDLSVVSLGVGVGPNFFVNFMSDAPEYASFGFNAKAHVDINLGNIKISAYYIIMIESIGIANIEDSLNFGTAGVSVLFKLF